MLLTDVVDTMNEMNIHMWQSQIEIEYYSVVYLSALWSLMPYSAELLLRAGLVRVQNFLYCKTT